MSPCLRPLALAGVLAALALPALAQNRDAAFATTTLNLSAQGEAKIAPDMATLTLGAETTAGSAARAIAENAQKMTQVVAALKRAGIAERDLATSSIGLSAQYAYEEGKAPRLTGYQATNQLTVTVRELTALGAIVDAASTAGATSIGDISFGLANPVAAEDVARIAAVKALDDKAALYARAVGYHIVRLVNLNEGEGYLAQPARPMGLMAARAPAAPTPVEAGEMSVRVSINAVYELAK